MEELMVRVEGPFDLDLSMTCGQVFGWRKVGERWFGQIDGVPVCVSMHEGSLRIFVQRGIEEKRITEYFALKEDLTHILDSIDKDPTIGEAIRNFRGLRVLKQDPWECLVSFICSTNTNVNAIQRMVSNLSKRLGFLQYLEREKVWTLPTPEKIARSSEKDLRACGLGYRARNLWLSSKVMESDPALLTRLRRLEYESAWEVLTGKRGGKKIIYGVGPKIADCLLLFSMGKTEAFPIDVWIKRILLARYSELMDRDLIESLRKREGGSRGLTVKEYTALSRTMRSYFGRYSGYAQEYLYIYSRKLGAKAVKQARGNL